MNRYCYIMSVGVVEPGSFLEYQVKTISGKPFGLVGNFVDAFALRLMQRYESQPVDVTLEIAAGYLTSPDRTRDFYSRLFRLDGQYTPDFVTIASETMGLWIEETLEGILLVHCGIPHNSDPAYDVLSIYEEEGVSRLRVIQVKATESELQNNCNVALAKFEQLEKGTYDAELSASLDLLLRQRQAPDGLVARDLKLNRRYRVTVVHGQNRDGISIMTTYDKKVRGDVIRRSGMLIRIDWPDLWEQVARRVYAQLA